MNRNKSASAFEILTLIPALCCFLIFGSCGETRDIFVLELGANDGLRGIPGEETKRNLQAIIDTVRQKNPKTEILLAGMQIPPNLGAEYTSEFRELFPLLQVENELHLIPFLLDGVAGDAALNQQDEIHPTAEGQQILA